MGWLTAVDTNWRHDSVTATPNNGVDFAGQIGDVLFGTRESCVDAVNTPRHDAHTPSGSIRVATSKARGESAGIRHHAVWCSTQSRPIPASRANRMTGSGEDAIRTTTCATGRT